MDAANTYLERAWRDLNSDEGWWKAIFAFGLINCVPLIGQVVMFGYLFDWAKEGAWGMNVPLSRQIGNLGTRLKYGFMALWVMIIWIAPLLFVAWLLSFIPTLGGVSCFLVQVFAILMCAVASAAAFRSIIYEHVMPGLQVRRVFHMVRKDPGGLAQAFAIILLIIPLMLAALFVVLLPAIPFINLIATTTISSALGADLALLVSLGMLTVVVSLVVWIVGAIVSALICAMYVRALGYWMEQFQPGKWGTPNTPMPFELEREAKKAEKAKRKKEAREAKRRHGKKDGGTAGEAPEPLPTDGRSEQSDDS